MCVCVCVCVLEIKYHKNKEGEKMREWNETDISVNEKKEYTKKNKKIGQWKYNKDREHKNN